jgi:hypothetical protein
MSFRNVPYAGEHERDDWRVFCDAGHCKVSINQEQFAVGNTEWATVPTMTREFHLCPLDSAQFHSLFGVATPSQIIREVKA